MTDNTQSRFGFVNFAETWNGRLAMLGFVIGLSTELLTGQGILTQLGLGWSMQKAVQAPGLERLAVLCQLLSWEACCKVFLSFWCWYELNVPSGWKYWCLLFWTMFALTLGNLELSNASAAILSLVSLLFLVSFIFVSVKNDNEGLMKWMFTDPSRSRDD